MRITSLLSCLLLVLSFAVDVNAAPERGLRCSDGIDNDGDGFVDGNDSDCREEGDLGGYTQVRADCTTNPDKLLELWPTLQSYGRLEIEVVGQCNFDGLSLVDRSVRFSGPTETDQQSDPFSCSPESLDSALRLQSSDGDGFGGIGVTAGSLSFGCLRLIADDGAIGLYGFSNSYIRVNPGFEVDPETTLDVSVRNNSTVRFFEEVPIGSLRVRGSSVAQLYGTSSSQPSLDIDIQRAVVVLNSSLQCFVCQGGDIGSLSLRNGSRAHIALPETTDVLNIGRLYVAEASSFVAEQNTRDCTPVVDIGEQEVDATSAVIFDASAFLLDGPLEGPCTPQPPPPPQPEETGEIYVQGQVGGGLYLVGLDETTEEPYCGLFSFCPTLEWPFVTDPDRGQILEVSHFAEGSQLFAFGFDGTRDFSAYAGGTIEFDINLVDPGVNSSGFVLGVYCGGAPCSTEIDLGVIGAGGWQTVTIPIDDLVAAGLSLSSVQVPFALGPAFGEQDGVVYQLDNVRWVAP